MIPIKHWKIAFCFIRIKINYNKVIKKIQLYVHCIVVSRYKNSFYSYDNLGQIYGQAVHCELLLHLS